MAQVYLGAVTLTYELTMMHLDSALASWRIPQLPDELGDAAVDISEEKQDIYLWHKGFKTGEQIGYEEISRKYGISPMSVKEVIARVESLCTV